ncbi:hypothetical protein CLV91_0639 [Maribacter vaceletii]|uniref:Uncharacterized protein n=1 Tax=Maribacter vaceletii TaxID=1206816 RepID=A0A495ECG5_9FLAO|nr:hypothetical protein [Maribacter vaceletii]RKR14562.1 hypothetical protein CLV91_0639 [Maribacter vaceletii]
MKQNKFLSMLFILTLLFVGCEEQEDLNITDVSHRVIVTSEMNFENKVIVGGDIDFGDISRGVESRTWTLPANGNIVDGGSGQTSSENVIKAKFNKAGVYDVVLNQKFKGNVFRNEDSSEPSDTRELDTTIVVTVLDSISSVLKAHRVNPDGSTGTELNLADNAEHELEASNFIRLSYTAIGEPQNINWSSDGGKPNKISHELTDDFVDMKFSKLGSWDLQYIADRFRPTDADTLFFEKLIKVIPSTAPVTLDRVAEREDLITLEFSREIDAATVNANDFAVRIENNTDEMNPIVLTPTVASVSVDKDEATIVILELDGTQLYNDDQVYVSYTPGALRTTDEVASEGFTDVLLTDFDPLINIYPNTAYDHSFESTDVSNYPYQNWGAPWDGFDISMDLETPRTGEKSLKVNLRPNGGMIVRPESGGNPITFPIETGKRYEFGYWIYIESDLTALPTGSESADIQLYAHDWSGPNLVPTTFTSDMPTGEWFYQSQIFDAGAGRDITWLIRGFNEFHDNALVFYLDDFFLAEVPVRP